MRSKIAALLAVFLWAGEASADFQAGVGAFERGDYGSALREWLPLANKGDPEAQYNIAILYYWGKGVSKNLDEAQEWFRRSAEQGNSRAQYNLAEMLESGEGPPGAEAEILSWYRKSAEQSFAPAQFNLGMIFHEGRLGQKKAPKTAVKWFAEAAEQGDSDAQYMVVIANLSVDLAWAWAWMRYAQGQGHPEGWKLQEQLRPLTSNNDRKWGEAYYHVMWGDTQQTK